MTTIRISGVGVSAKTTTVTHATHFTKTDRKIFLNCPFEEKDAAKALGARWDNAEKMWYITERQKIEDFKKWISISERSQLDPQSKSSPSSFATSSRGGVVAGSKKRKLDES